MSQAVRDKNSYRDAFDSRRGETRAGEPAWVARLREDAFERFEQLGFPTTDEEDWKYTNVAPIARGDFAPAPHGRGDEARAEGEVDEQALAQFVYGEARRSRLVFVDGRLRADLSALEGLPEGVVVGDLQAALAGEHAETLRERLSRAASFENDAFAALNTAFLGGGAFIHLPKGARVESPVHLLFLAGAGRAEQAAANFPRVLVVAERESELTLVESYAAVAGAGVYFTDSVAEVYLGEGARVTHYKVQAEGERAFHVAATRAELSRASAYDLTTITLGGHLSRHNVAVGFDEEGAECWVDGLYLVGDGQHADTHSLIDHRRPNCTSHQNYKGILDGRSRAVFNGRVFVHAEARGTDAVQSNKNLLLSDEARVDTKPQLEIFNDDVKCAHGATVGQLEEEELFYLLSRGLHETLARNLLTYGFAEEIVEKIKLDSIKAQLDDAILGRLRARLEA